MTQRDEELDEDLRAVARRLEATGKALLGAGDEIQPEDHALDHLVRATLPPGLQEGPAAQPSALPDGPRRGARILEAAGILLAVAALVLLWLRPIESGVDQPGLDGSTGPDVQLGGASEVRAEAPRGALQALTEFRWRAPDVPGRSFRVVVRRVDATAAPPVLESLPLLGTSWIPPASASVPHDVALEWELWIEDAGCDPKVVRTRFRLAPE